MTEWDRPLDEDAAANRIDARPAAIASIVGLAATLGACALLFIGGIPAP